MCAHGSKTVQAQSICYYISVHFTRTSACKNTRNTGSSQHCLLSKGGSHQFKPFVPRGLLWAGPGPSLIPVALPMFPSEMPYVPTFLGQQAPAPSPSLKPFPPPASSEAEAKTIQWLRRQSLRIRVVRTLLAQQQPVLSRATLSSGSGTGMALWELPLTRTLLYTTRSQTTSLAGSWACH